ncbi:MerR family transcriptional regulator [Streptomyces sp. NPDC015171]|uniref:MerR family transcriptional regulator n=1 Tax=Streptomyces sp. NPDC015171 TaxID=3364945 RepID=UPI0037013BF4
MHASEAPGPPRPGTGDPALTTGGLARRLGVSPTTLRSWDRRYGMGPAARADGRHRRWTPEDVRMLETMCRLTASGVPPAEAAEAARAAREGAARTAARHPADLAPAPPRPANGAALAVPDGVSPDEVRLAARGLGRAAVRLDAGAVGERLEGAMTRYGLLAAWQEIMVPTLHAVGRRWASAGDRYVAVEHLLSWQVSTTLRRHTRRPTTTAGSAGPGPVLLACVPGEQHTLALEALDAALSRRGVPTRMFGAAVPVEALLPAVRRLGPAAVMLWAQARSTANPPLAEHVAAMEWGVKGARAQPLTLLGGPGWSGRPSRGMLRPTALAEAVDILTTGYDSALSSSLP